MRTARTGGPTAPCECLVVGVAVWFVLSPSVCTDVVREVERVTVVIMLVVIVVLFYAKKMLKMGNMMMLMHGQGCAVYLVRLNINVYAR